MKTLDIFKTFMLKKAISNVYLTVTSCLLTGLYPLRSGSGSYRSARDLDQRNFYINGSYPQFRNIPIWNRNSRDFFFLIIKSFSKKSKLENIFNRRFMHGVAWMYRKPILFRTVASREWVGQGILMGGREEGGLMKRRGYLSIYFWTIYLYLTKRGHF